MAGAAAGLTRPRPLSSGWAHSTVPGPREPGPLRPLTLGLSLRGQHRGEAGDAGSGKSTHAHAHMLSPEGGHNSRWHPAERERGGHEAVNRERSDWPGRRVRARMTERGSGKRSCPLGATNCSFIHPVSTATWEQGRLYLLVTGGSGGQMQGVGREPRDPPPKPTLRLLLQAHALLCEGSNKSRAGQHTGS